MMNSEKPKRKGHTPQSKGRGRGILWIRAHVNHLDDDCLYWPMHKDTKGYGLLGYNGKMWLAHRLMCTLAHGEPPTAKHQAGHECGNGSKGCVNPRHLRWKTNGENQKDKLKHGTKNVICFGPVSRLTPQQIEEIKALRGVVPIMELARRYGVKRGTIDRWHRIARDGYDFNAIRPKNSLKTLSD